MPSYKGDTGVYESDMLVVDLPYMGRVREMVVALGGDPDAIDRGEQSHALSLTRFRLPGLAGISTALGARVAQAQSSPSQLLDRVRPPQPGASDLDRLLFLLRLDFARRNDYWLPDLGKDRKAETITGLPHLSGGLAPAAVEYPRVPDPVTYLPAADKQLGKDVRVGVLDTRLFRDPQRPDVPVPESQLEIDNGSWLVPRDTYPHWAGHGTFVLGLIAAQAPGATVVFRGVLDDDHARATSWDVAHQIVAMRERGVQILNLSLGLLTDDGQEPLVLGRAVRQLGPDVVIVAAAGNHGDPQADTRWPDIGKSDTVFPAAAPGVIAVGALEQTGVANFTPKVSWLRFFAEGAKQQSTYLTGNVEIQLSPADDPLVFDVIKPGDEPLTEKFDGYAEWAGTSMAAAVVSGRLAALTRYTGGNPFDAIDLLAGGPSGGSAYTGPLTGPSPVRRAGDSVAAEDDWRN